MKHKMRVVIIGEITSLNGWVLRQQPALSGSSYVGIVIGFRHTLGSDFWSSDLVRATDELNKEKSGTPRLHRTRAIVVPLTVSSKLRAANGLIS